MSYLLSIEATFSFMRAQRVMSYHKVEFLIYFLQVLFPDAKDLLTMRASRESNLDEGISVFEEWECAALNPLSRALRGPVR